MDYLETIPIENIIDPWILLRPVMRDSVEYLEMKASLDAVGFLNSIAVRPSTRRPGLYEVIDGMWRTTASRELRFKELPCLVKPGVTDDRVLELQLQANAIRPETKPCDFARQLRRIQKIHEGITLRELSSLVNKKPTWVTKQLGLLRLEPKIQIKIDRGEMPLANAYSLSKIPPKLRPEYVDHAVTMPVKAFSALSAAVIKQFKEAVKQGKLDAFFSEDFKPQPYLKSLKDIIAEVETLSEGNLVIATENCETPTDGWIAALKWAANIDAGGVAKQEHVARCKARKTWKGT